MLMLRRVHRWCGLILVGFLVLAGLTGAVVAFRGDIIRLTVPQAHGAAPSVTGYGAAIEAFEAQNGPVQSVSFAPDGIAVHRVYLPGGSGAFITSEGKVVERWAGATRIEQFALRLHHTLLLGDTGKQVMGMVGLAGTGMLISGLVIYWPGRRLFARKFWPRSFARAELRKSHGQLGLVLALPLLLQFASGAAIEFERPLRQWLVAKPAIVLGTPAAPMHWPQIIALAQAQNPQAVLRSIAAPRKPGAPYMARLQAPGDINPEGATKVMIAGGEAITTKTTRVGALLDSMLGVHAIGYVGGLAAQLALALLGVFLAMLGVFGAAAWFRGQRR